MSAQLKRILIVRMSAMGDIIHAMPAVAALHQALPAAHIGWLVEERWSALLGTRATSHPDPRSPQRPLADQIHTVDTKRWRKSLLSSGTRRSFLAATSELKNAHYDAAIDFQGLLRSAIFSRISGAPVRYGFAHPRESAARWFYTSPVDAEGIHVVEQNLSLAQAVAGAPLTAQPVKLPHDEVAERKVDREVADRSIGRFAILNPGAGWGAKQWPADRYGAVASQLAAEGISSLVNYGPGEENLALAVEAKSDGAAKGISLSLAELIALTRRASLFIGGDTGPMHLAAALDVPVVAVFGPTDPARNGPYGTRSIVLRDPTSVTDHSRQATPQAGLLQISPEQVIAAAEKLLGGGV